MSRRAEHAGMYIAAEEMTPAIVVVVAFVALVVLGWYAWKQSGIGDFWQGLTGTNGYDPNSIGLAYRLGLASAAAKDSVVVPVGELQRGSGVLAAFDMFKLYAQSAIDVLQQHFTTDFSISTGA